MNEKRCFGCMHPKGAEPFCSRCGYDQRTPNAPHQLPPGTVLRDQYLVGRALGQGGFGITYIGWDQFLDIPVAIKEYYPSGLVTRETRKSLNLYLYNEKGREAFVNNRDRFVREATSLARLGRDSRISNIVRVQNLVQDNATAYIIMEYVDGIDLKRYMKNKGGRLTPEETLRLLLPVMESLEKVHENNIVHRDISPDNIMVMPDGRTKLVDFGAAHEVQAEGGLLHSTAAILKYGFAPVEQYQRKGELGPWTDVYAMCATIYYCITGLLPPNATDLLTGEEDFRWDALGMLQPQQIKALRQGLAIRKKDRIQNMAQLRRALTSAPAAAPVTMEPIPVTVPVEPIPRTVPVEPLSRTVPIERPQIRNIPKAGSPGSNLLMSDTISANNIYMVFGSRNKRTDIGTVTFRSTLAGAPPSAWDVSQKKDRSVLAWVEKAPGAEFKDLYIAANGGVTAPEDCSQMFCNYRNVTQFRFDGCLDTSRVTNMMSMFASCTKVSDLDLSSFDFGRIKGSGLCSMFYNCQNLRTADLSCLNTARLNNVYQMFHDCGRLETVAVGKIDMTNVVNRGRFARPGVKLNGNAWESYFP